VYFGQFISIFIEQKNNEREVKNLHFQIFVSYKVKIKSEKSLLEAFLI
jgi:hypothetical protein